MTITEALGDTYFLWTGKSATPPSSKLNSMILALDRYQRRWAREPGVDWSSLYDPAFSIGNVTATDSFDLDTSSIRTLSKREGDVVRIIHTDKVGYTDYDIVEAVKLKDYQSGANKEGYIGHHCAKIGNSLVFNHKFSTDDAQFGGTIYVPIFGFPDQITNDSPDNDEVQVDDPDWLTTRAAAALCRNDIVRRSRWPELLAEANTIMGRMREDNEGQIDTIDTPWTPFTGSPTGSDGAFD